MTAVHSPAGEHWLLWVSDRRRPGWTDAEAAALALAGQALGRWLAAGGTRWAAQLDREARQQRMETAAQVTRRLAHDFGNVLTGILGFTELALAQQIPAGTALHTYLSEVYRGAQAGAQFTHQLQLFSRRQSASSRSCTLGLVLAELEPQQKAAGREAGLNLSIALPDDLPPVALDAEHLRLVLGALLDNAREALLGPGCVSLSARVTELQPPDCQDLFGACAGGPHVEVCVADTGVGLSPEAQRRVFNEPFYSTKPKRRGFGLAIAYGVLHAHRGGLQLHPGEERGVVARVLLPVAPGPAPGCPDGPTWEAESAQLVPAPRGERVLVVDDDPMVLEFVTATLVGAGYRVQAVSNAADALHSYFSHRADPFRLVLSDVRMPDVDGTELARRLLKRDADARVLFMSGQVNADFIKQDCASQPIELLTKPFRPEGLLRAVRWALDRPRRGTAPRPLEDDKVIG
jgi:signal transduction histidine kinase/CheY-like chemotaxis protein